MSEPDALDLAGVAAELGLHYDTVRKHWRAWADPLHPEYTAFPRPFLSGGRGRHGALRWRRTAVADWKLSRERAFCRPAPERGAPLGRPVGRREHLERQRATLARLMERA